MCGINFIAIAIFAVVMIAIYLIIQAIPFFAPFKQIINIIMAALVALFIITQVLAPLFACVM